MYARVLMLNMENDTSYFPYTISSKVCFYIRPLYYVESGKSCGYFPYTTKIGHQFPYTPAVLV